MPAQLFQGSLLLGGIAKAVLGQGAVTGGPTLIHPFLVGGWCGLVVTALNLLPVGSLDGGRMVQVGWIALRIAACAASYYCSALHDAMGQKCGALAAQIIVQHLHGGLPGPVQVYPISPDAMRG